MKKLFLLGILCLCAAHAAQAQPSKPKKAKNPPQKKACRLNMSSMKGETPTYKYDIQYPQFESPCRSVNPKFRAFAADTLEGFRKDYSSMVNPNGQKNEVVTRYAVYCSSQNLISVRLNTYMYTGGAHGLSSIDTISRNPGAGLDQTWERLVPDPGYALEQLSSIAYQDLLAQLKAAGAGPELDLNWLRQGTSSAATNYDQYTLDGQGNVFIQIPQYQVAPYCYGELQVKVALENLKAPKATAHSGIANPASVNCEKQGGKLTIAKNSGGAEYGICVFEDNRQCEEWALFRKQCPKGGVKVTGYTTPETVYCAITGHEAVEGSDGKPGTCTVDGKTCPALEYYTTGACGLKQSN